MLFMQSEKGWFEGKDTGCCIFFLFFFNLKNMEQDKRGIVIRKMKSELRKLW